MTTLIDRQRPDCSDARSVGDGVLTTRARAGLATINEPALDLAIWRRTLPDGLQAWIDALDVSRLPNIRILVDPDILKVRLAALLDACGMAPCTERGLLIEDVDLLIKDFARITESTLVDVRLDRIDSDACWKFHRDNVEQRLVTTYRGPATEWVVPANAERAIDEQRDYDGPLERFERHDVAIFKGSSAGPARGIVHRSPPIAGTGTTRLLLCLNNRSVTSPPQLT